MNDTLHDIQVYLSYRDKKRIPEIIHVTVKIPMSKHNGECVAKDILNNEYILPYNILDNIKVSLRKLKIKNILKYDNK